MAPLTAVPATVLVASARSRPLPGLPLGDGDSVVQVATAARALEWVREVRPDLIVLDAELPDLDGLETCGLLHSDARIMHTVPILILTDGQPTPEQRVAAVHAGAWDFVRSDEGPEACAAKFRIYLQAKRNLDAALGTAPKGVVGRAEFTRRARELGALMARMRGGLACLVTALDASVSDRSASAMVRCARVSDTVGMLGPVEMAILAPATDRTGAVKLAHRIADAVRDADGGRDPLADGGMRIGYEAVANVTYAPIDPVDLLARAAAAARTGVPEAGCKWLRRFDPAAAATAAAARHTPPGVVLDGGRLP